MKFLSFVTRSDQKVPQLDKWMKTNDPAAKEAAMQKLVRQTLTTRDLTELDRVQDNVPVSFGDTGLILYEAEEIPEAFTWTFVAVRSDQDLREAAGDAKEFLDEPGFSSFSTNILSLIQAAGNPGKPRSARHDGQHVFRLYDFRLQAGAPGRPEAQVEMETLSESARDRAPGG